MDYMWRRLSGAAIFNEVFVIYANRPGPFFLGNSGVFNSQGQAIIKAGRREAILEAEKDLTEIGGWQEQEPIFSYRRPLLCREIVNRHKAESVVAESQIREVETISARGEGRKRVT